jgi:hypothetical protein
MAVRVTSPDLESGLARPVSRLEVTTGAAIGRTGFAEKGCKSLKKSRRFFKDFRDPLFSHHKT